MEVGILRACYVKLAVPTLVQPTDITRTQYTSSQLT
jgi:hypothetical protein